MSSGFRAVANTRQPRAFISRAEASPIPEEQPVMRTLRDAAESFMLSFRWLTRGRRRGSGSRYGPEAATEELGKPIAP